MGKDPAVLFYTSDFLTGTAFFSKAQRGEYITLLCEQHQLWSIPEEHLISVCGSLESPVAKKFKKDKDGSWYNTRMREETEKRQKYADSRRKNIGSRWSKNDKPLSGKKIDNIHMNNMCNTHVDTYGIHMENENEDENKDENEDEKTSLKTKRKRPEKTVFTPPQFEEFKAYCVENGFGEIADRAFKGYEAGGWRDSQGKQIKSWKQKLQHVWFREENKEKKTEEFFPAWKVPMK